MLELVISPNNVLLEKATECDLGSAELKGISQEMARIMYENEGVGLAAPQVGISKRLIVIDTEYDSDDEDSQQNPIVLINPEIVDKSKETEDTNEGCLSCPGILAPVIRHKWVKVKYFDLDGKQQFIEGEGILSHCLQHEIDHLNGKTLFQTAKPEARLQLIQDYQEIMQQ